MVTIGKELDKVTDAQSSQSVIFTVVLAICGIAVIVIFVIVALLLSRRTSKAVITSITEPLHEIEEVAGELTRGNLHTTIDYRSEDEIGKLAHDLRKSIRILGTYVDDIARPMKEFSEGNFAAQPEVEWKGDFIGILESLAIKIGTFFLSSYRNIWTKKLSRG